MQFMILFLKNITNRLFLVFYINMYLIIFQNISFNKSISLCIKHRIANSIFSPHQTLDNLKLVQFKPSQFSSLQLLIIIQFSPAFQN